MSIAGALLDDQGKDVFLCVGHDGHVMRASEESFGDGNNASRMAVAVTRAIIREGLLALYRLADHLIAAALGIVWVVCERPETAESFKRTSDRLALELSNNF